jgi:hypothetical protein
MIVAVAMGVAVDAGAAVAVGACGVAVEWPPDPPVALAVASGDPPTSGANVDDCPDDAVADDGVPCTSCPEGWVAQISRKTARSGTFNRSRAIL